jgi:hypothetical protein
MVYCIKVEVKFALEQVTKAFCTKTGVSVADRPALKQNFMATLCSFPPTMTYKEN